MLHRRWITALDPPPKLPPHYGRYASVIAVTHKPGHWLILAVNKNIRGSNKSVDFPNAKVPGGYDIFEYSPDGSTRRISSGYDTPHEATQSMEAIAPILGETHASNNQGASH